MLPEDKDSVNWNNYKFNPWVSQLWVTRRIMQKFELEFHSRCPSSPVVYIRPNFKAEPLSFF